MNKIILLKVIFIKQSTAGHIYDIKRNTYNVGKKTDRRNCNSRIFGKQRLSGVWLLSRRQRVEAQSSDSKGNVYSPFV